jgi:bifunctional non-homologous end joining protein LigD
MAKLLHHALWMTRPEKVLFPQDGITKENLADYYQQVAPFMLPFTKNRPLAMLRYPDGITGESFYQKDIPEYFPAWIARHAITNKDGTVTTYVVCQNTKTLLYLAYQACITPHVWLSRIDKLDYPDRMIFDLDPGEKTTFEIIKGTALLIRDSLEKLGIISFAMTTGSRGIHVVVPLRRVHPFEVVHAYAHDLALAFARSDPDQLTADVRKEERRGRLFIDFMRTTYGHLAVVPYAVRALPTAPVATPVTWKEVETKELQARTYTLRNFKRRLDAKGDVWPTFPKVKNTLKGV